MSRGAVHYIVIEFSDDFNDVGVPGVDGRVAAIAVKTVDDIESPTTFLAIILKL